MTINLESLLAERTRLLELIEEAKRAKLKLQLIDRMIAAYGHDGPSSPLRGVRPNANGKFVCDICGKESPTAQGLGRHRANHGNGHSNGHKVSGPQRVLDIMRQSEGPLTNTQLQKLFGSVSRAGTLYHLRQLSDEKLVRKVGKGSQTRWELTPRAENYEYDPA
jgi:hypothetical protein